MMNSRVENLRRWPANLARDQSQPGFRVNRSFMLGEHNQRRTALIQARIHARRDLHAAGERKTNMDAIAHFVCRKRALNLVGHFLARRNFGER